MTIDTDDARQFVRNELDTLIAERDAYKSEAHSHLEALGKVAIDRDALRARLARDREALKTLRRDMSFAYEKNRVDGGYYTPDWLAALDEVLKEG